MKILSVDTVAFSILGYQMSYIEFFGTILYLWSVWLISKRRPLTWPVGIISVLLYMILFYQIRLYSDTIEQIYYLGASVYGWWLWNKSPKNEGRVIDIAFSNWQAIIFYVVITLFLTAVVGFFMSNIHTLFPEIFPDAAAYPYIDGFTTIMSFIAMWLMARKKIESWAYWILVDIIGIWLYFIKDVKFVSLLYVVLLFLAINGFSSWVSTRKNPNFGLK